VVTLQARGMMLDAPPDSHLYNAYTTYSKSAQPVALTAIPYFAWANREPGAMRVWIPRRT